MTKLFTFIGIISFIFFSTFIAESQNKKDPFSKLDKSKIKTGLLYNKVKLPISKIHEFNGVTNLKVINSYEWRDIYSEIYSASLTKNLTNYQSLKKDINPKIRKNIFPIGIIDYSFNEFKKDAIKNGLIKFTNNKYISMTDDIYDEYHVFASSIIKTKQYTGLSVSYDFSEKYYYSNSKTKLEYLTVDFGNGTTQKKVKLNDVIKVLYKSEGNKTITIKANYEDGTSFTSKFTIKISVPKMPTPSETWTGYTSDESYLGVFAEGEVGIFFGTGNTDFTRPVIIVDGFDPGDTRDIAGLWDIANQQNMVDNLRAEGYDFVIVNFYGGDDYIQRNAMLVKKVIQEINNRMTAAGTMKTANQIAVIGPSMGGLITRYAIRTMEQNGINHNVRNWISFDSPMKGANIPLGLQHWVRYFAEDVDVESAMDALISLSGPAAKQMLTYHYTATTSNTANCNGLFTTFYNELNAMGFPENTRIASIINGNGYGTGQGFFGGDQIIYYEYKASWPDPDIWGNCWAVPNQTSTRVFEGYVDMPWPYSNIDREDIYVNNTFPLDGAPGGSRNTLKELADTDPGYGNITAPWDAHAFIPTISALCIENTTDPYFNVNTNLATLITPFDKIYYPSENQEHVAITPESYLWFYHEVINFAPQFTSTPITTVDEDATYSYILSSIDENEWNILTYELVEKPTWLNFNSSTGEFYGTPLNEDVGLHNVSVKVKDELDETIQTFTITVVNTNDAPIITSNEITSATEDTEYSYTFTATDEDPNPDVLTFSAVEIPNWLSFDANTGILSGTPLNEDVGNHNITLRVNDGTVDVDQSFLITVTNTNDAPIITSNEITLATEDAEYSYTFTATDEDPNPDVLTFSAVEIPNWLSFDANTGILSGTPLNEDVGNHNITLRVNDGTVDVDQSFIITVTNTNDVPFLQYELIDQEIYTNELFSYTFAENSFIDIDVEDILSYNALLTNGYLLPEWLSFNPTSRTFEGTPTESATYDITVIATDSYSESVTDNFTINVLQSISVNEVNSNIKIYPNPTSEYLHINLNEEFSYLQIISVAGKVIKNININHSKIIEINVSNINSGIYFVKFMNDTETIIKKIIIQK